jgi:four helix bundle protein
MEREMAKMAFESLEIYQLAEKLSDQIWKLVRRWDQLAKDTVGKQMNRAADSIGANIAEGCGRGTSRDNCRFIHTARGSLYETVHFLRRAYQRQLLTQIEIEILTPITAELGPRLNACLKAIAAGPIANNK